RLLAAATAAPATLVADDRHLHARTERARAADHHLILLPQPVDDLHHAACIVDDPGLHEGHRELAALDLPDEAARPVNVVAHRRHGHDERVLHGVDDDLASRKRVALEYALRIRNRHVHRNRARRGIDRRAHARDTTGERAPIRGETDRLARADVITVARRDCA